VESLRWSILQNLKGNSWDMMSLTFHDKKESFTIQTNKIEGEWLVAMLAKIAVVNTKVLTFRKLRQISRVIWKTLNCFGIQSQLTL
jgi:hypothetical protein